MNYLQEVTFGVVTIHFESVDNKTLINVNDVPKEKLSFYLKSGINLIDIYNNIFFNDLITSDFYDSSKSYVIKKVL